ncbi:MAG: response regulator [Chloroflexaceae bacterium]|nr:response regulator [Chloroflexaceae bacterium]
MPRSPVVLIIEDDDATRRMYTFLLGSYGYQVIEAIDGQEALEKLATQMIDVLITGYAMPGISGLELIQKARQQGHQTYIIFITALDLASIERSALQHGANAYIGKPFEIEQLLLHLGEGLQRASSGSLLVSR